AVSRRPPCRPVPAKYPVENQRIRRSHEYLREQLCRIPTHIICAFRSIWKRKGERIAARIRPLRHLPKPVSLRMNEVFGFRSCLSLRPRSGRLVTKIRRLAAGSLLGGLRRSFVTSPACQARANIGRPGTGMTRPRKQPESEAPPPRG